jgi:hypothetical protein
MKVGYIVLAGAWLWAGTVLAADPIDAIQGRWSSGFGADLVIAGTTGTVASQGKSGFTTFLKVGDAAIEDIHFVRDESSGVDQWLVFEAKCRGNRWTPGSPPKPCTVVLEATTNRPDLKPRLGVPGECCLHFTFVGRASGPAKVPTPAPASKPAAGPAQAMCSARDIQGNWDRSDGARIVVDGMDFKDGGRALLHNHPRGWPAGTFKFTDIKLASDCEYKATCQTVQRNSAGGGFNITRESCTLKLDRKAGTLTASGAHGSYRR